MTPRPLSLAPGTLVALLTCTERVSSLLAVAAAPGLGARAREALADRGREELERFRDDHAHELGRDPYADRFVTGMERLIAPERLARSGLATGLSHAAAAIAVAVAARECVDEEYMPSWRALAGRRRRVARRLRVWQDRGRQPRYWDHLFGLARNEAWRPHESVNVVVPVGMPRSASRPTERSCLQAATL